MEKLMVLVHITIVMEISMMDNSRMTQLMAMVNLNTKMAKPTKAIGKMIFKKEKVKK